MVSRYDEAYYKRRCLVDGIRDGPEIEVKVIDERVGKGLFATKRLEKGVEIWRERPRVAIQHIPSSTDVISCANCFRDVGTMEEQLELLGQLEPGSIDPLVDGARSTISPVVSCDRGCGTVYCSTTCASEAWREHHQLLCVGDIQSKDHPLFQFKLYCLEYNEIFQLGARVFANIVRTCHETGVMSRHPFNLLRAIPWSEAVVYNSEDEQEETHDHSGDECCPSSEGDMFTSKLSAEELEQHALGAYELLRQALLHESIASRDPELAKTTQRCFEEGIFDVNFFSCCIGMFETNCTSIELHSPIESFLKKIRGKPEVPNVLALLEKLAPSELGDDAVKEVTPEVLASIEDRFLGFEGIGVYDLIAVMNHSCTPNTVVTYTRDRIATVETTRVIEEGEELTHSYIEGYEDSTVEERNRFLRCWGFVCVCPACV